MTTEDRYGQGWTRDEITLALSLYCQISFGQTTARNPFVKALAEHLGRTPSSVARKLGNFGSFDPTLAARGVVGLTNASRTDREVWDQYSGNWAALVDAAHALWTGSTLASESMPEPAVPQTPAGPSQSLRLQNVRLHQAFFRRTVLSSYDSTCCACGLEHPALLTASHIVPWSHDEALRTDPTNGLSLCALHDRAFDRGLIAVSADGAILVSDALHRLKSEASRKYLIHLAGAPLRAARRFAPKPEHLAWHRENIFAPNG